MRIDSRGRVGSRARALFLAIVALTMADLLVAEPGVAATKKGGAKPDSLSGTPRADSLLGAGGDDTLLGRAGADELVGGPGDDRLRGEAGSDKLLGGGGSDLLLAKDGEADTVNCGGGADDVAVADAVDRVSTTCEQVAGAAAREPSAPVAGPPAPIQYAPPIASAPSPETTPPPAQEPELEFEERPLAMFPAGHGWAGNGVGTFGDVGSPLVVNTDRSYRIITNGLGSESVATSPPLEAVDLTGSHVSVQAQISFSSRLDAVKLRLASGDIATDYAEVTVWETDLDPIILGSSFEIQSLPLGRFEVTGDVDWSEIDRAQIVLTDNQAGPLTLYVAGIYAVPTSHQATVSFAFDDGYASTFTRGMKKLSAYRYPATAYVITNVLGDPGILSLEQLYALRDQHHWEIAGHALALASHNLPDGLDDLEPEALKAEMDGLRSWLDEHGFSRATFAYPKGAAGPKVRQFVKRDYCAGRSTARGPETVPTRDNYTMRGWSINGVTDGAAEVKAEIDGAIAEGSWLMLSFHDIVGGAADIATEFGDDEFDEVVDYVRGLQKKGELKVRTVAGALSQQC